MFVLISSEVCLGTLVLRCVKWCWSRMHYTGSKVYYVIGDVVSVEENVVMDSNFFYWRDGKFTDKTCRNVQLIYATEKLVVAKLYVWVLFRLLVRVADSRHAHNDKITHNFQTLVGGSRKNCCLQKNLISISLTKINTIFMAYLPTKLNNDLHQKGLHLFHRDHLIPARKRDNAQPFIQ